MAASSSAVNTLVDHPDLMAIPKKIHFFWIGKTLPEEYKENIIDWAQKAKEDEYQVFLWTDEATLENPIVCDSLQREKVHLQHWKENSFGNTRYKKAINLVQSIIDEGAKPDASSNYAACSDIMRVVILHRDGGLYDDTDNYISVFDKNIGTIQVIKDIGLRIIGINQCLMAALPESKVIDEILTYYERCFDNGILSTSQNINPAISKLASYPRYHKDRRLIETAHPEEQKNSLAYWVTRKEHFRNINIQMEESRNNSFFEIKFVTTIALTGPGLVCSFFKKSASDIDPQSTLGEYLYFKEAGYVKTFISDPDSLKKQQYTLTDGVHIVDGQHNSWTEAQTRYNNTIPYVLNHSDKVAEVPKAIHHVLLGFNPNNRTEPRESEQIFSKDDYHTIVWINGPAGESSEPNTTYKNWNDIVLTNQEDIDARLFVIEQLKQPDCSSEMQMICNLLISCIILLHEGGLVMPSAYYGDKTQVLSTILVPTATKVKISPLINESLFITYDKTCSSMLLPPIIASLPEEYGSAHYLRQTMSDLSKYLKTADKSATQMHAYTLLQQGLQRYSPRIKSGSLFESMRILADYEHNFFNIGTVPIRYNTENEALEAYYQQSESDPLLSNGKPYVIEHQSKHSPDFWNHPKSGLSNYLSDAIDRCLVRKTETSHPLLHLVNNIINNNKPDSIEQIQVLVNELGAISYEDHGVLPYSREGKIALNILSQLQNENVTRDEFSTKLAEFRTRIMDMEPPSDKCTIS